MIPKEKAIKLINKNCEMNNKDKIYMSDITESLDIAIKAEQERIIKIIKNCKTRKILKEVLLQRIGEGDKK